MEGASKAHFIILFLWLEHNDILGDVGAKMLQQTTDIKFPWHARHARHDRAQNVPRLLTLP